MRFFLDPTNESDLDTTATAVVSNVTAPNQTSSSPVSSAELFEIEQTVFPLLGVLLFVLFLLRLCYKAIRDDGVKRPSENDYSQMVP